MNRDLRLGWIGFLGVAILIGNGYAAYAQDMGGDGAGLNEARGISPEAREASAEAAAAASSSSTTTESVIGRTAAGQMNVNYFMIFFGPSVLNPSGYQATAAGQPDPNRPVLSKNFLTAGYNVSNQVQISASGTWTYVPVMGQELILKDPYLRVAHNSIVSTDNFNLYGDLRFHLPVTTESREADMLAGMQLFNVAWYQFGTSRWAAGLYTSARMNVFGGLGVGDDLEVYAGPNVSYQLSPTVALTVLYEMGASHAFGEPSFHFNNDGTDLEPGVSWDITPRLNVNPYFTIFTGGVATVKNTSVGMTLNWAML